MTSSLALALALALAAPAAVPEASVAPAAESGSRALLAERITLNLQKADLAQVLERLATLLGKTLILQPGIEGSVSLEARETPVSEVLAGLQTSQALSIRIEGARMYVARAGEKVRSGPARPDEDGLDASFIADASLPRRLATEKPKRYEGAFEFREEGGNGSAVWEIGGSLATVSLPGCAGPQPVILLPGDSFDGVPRVVFGPRGGAASLARIVAPGGTVRLADCSTPLTLKALESRDGASRAVPVPQTEQYQLTVRVLEAGADGDEVLAAPSVQLALGEMGTVQSGSQRPASASGVALNQVIRMNVAVLSAGDAAALVACSVSVTREVEPEPGRPPVTIRIARADESLRLSYGKPARITVSPTYGRGHSALVLELGVNRIPGRR